MTSLGQTYLILQERLDIVNELGPGDTSGVLSIGDQPEVGGGVFAQFNCHYLILCNQLVKQEYGGRLINYSKDEEWLGYNSDYMTCWDKILQAEDRTSSVRQIPLHHPLFSRRLERN